ATLQDGSPLPDFIDLTDGVFTFAPAPADVTDPATPLVIVVTATDPDGESVSDTFTLAVNNLDPIAFTGGPYTIDADEILTLNGDAAGFFTDVTFAWDFDNDGLFDDATGPFATLDPAALGFAAGTVNTISVQITDENGGVATDTTTVTINDAPVIIPTPPTIVSPIADQSVDEGATLGLDTNPSFTPGTPGEGLTISATLQDGSPLPDFIDLTDGVFTFTPTNVDLDDVMTDYVLAVTATDPDGEFVTGEFTVTVNNLPPVISTGGPYTVDADGSVTLDASVVLIPGNTDVFTFAWDFDNDGLFDDATGPNAVLDAAAFGFTEGTVNGINLLVTDANGASTPGSTLVTVNDEATTLTNAVPVAGEIASLTDTDTYLIDATAGQQMIVVLGNLTGIPFETTVEVFAPDGTSIALDADTTAMGNEITIESLPATGTYTIVVSETDGDALGEYIIVATLTDPVIMPPPIGEGTDLVSGQTVTGDIDPAGDQDLFFINAAAGDDLLINVRETSNFFTNIEVSVFGPDNQLIDTFTAGAGLRADQLSVSQAGRYTIAVSDNDDTFTGTYNVTATVIDSNIDADNVALFSGQTEQGSLAAGDIDTFTIDAAAGDDLLINVRETSNFFTNIEVSVYGPDSELIDTFIAPAGIRADQFNVSQAGTYTVVVRDNDNVFTGGYSITATVIDSNVDADNIPLVSGQTEQG
ncbi:MAG: pre-peptidase C-terminal domain-containing protein, partial [Actinomycetota bacterium]